MSEIFLDILIDDFEPAESIGFSRSFESMLNAVKIQEEPLALRYVIDNYTRFPDILMQKIFHSILGSTIKQILILNSNLNHKIGGRLNGELATCESLDTRSVWKALNNTSDLSIIHFIHCEALTIKLIQILKKIINDPTLRSSIITLEETIQECDKPKNERIEILEAYKWNQDILIKLRKEFMKNREELNSDAYQKTKKELMDTYEDTYAQQMCEKILLKKWQNSRMEQNTLILLGKERGFEQVTALMETWKNREDLVHNTIKVYLKESKQDYQKDIKHWMNKHDNEMEQKDYQILDLKVRIENLQEDHQTLKNEYHKRQQQMADWLEHKRIQARRIWAANIIQLWWRPICAVIFAKRLAKKKKGKGKNQKGKKEQKGKKRK